MKKILKFIRCAIKELTSTLLEALISAIYPIIEVLSEISKLLVNIVGIQSSLISNILNESIISLKKNIRFSLIIYYIILLSTEVYMLIKVLLGIIYYFDFSTLFIYTTIIMFFNLIFVLFLNRHYKSKKFNYIIYFQILFLLPLIVVYWVANIEGHNLYLKNLNSDQWISLFNTIIIYFSGCLIGIITLYKNREEVKNEK